MLIAVAAVALMLSTPTDEQLQPKLEQPEAVRVEVKRVAGGPNRCAARVTEARAPEVRYDRDAAHPGALDRQPDRGEAQLFSTVELKVEGCSLPVLRARAGDVPPLRLETVPLDH